MSILRLICLLACLMAAAAASRAAAEPGRWNMPGPAPHLVIHYMPWYGAPDPSVDAHESWRHWSWDADHAHHDPDHRLAGGLRDLASVYHPLIGPYDSRDRAVIRYHLATIKAAGIQGVFVDWHGPGSEVDKPVPLILDEARRLGLKVALCYEEKSNFVWPGFRNPATRDDAVQNAVNDLKYILSHYAHDPAYMTRDGHPVLFQFNGWGDGPHGHNFYTPQEWDRIMAQLPEKFVYGRQGLDPAYSSSAQFRYLWVSLRAADNNSFSKPARALVDSGKAEFFMNMICPGFNDTGVWGWGGGPRVIDRKGLSFLKATFDQAFSDNPEVIQVITWNDFNEGTVMEPTREFGFDYLDALATWWAERHGRKADLAAIRKPYREYVRACTPWQRAELPANPEGDCLASHHLTVEVPDYLSVLAAQQTP